MKKKTIAIIAFCASVLLILCTSRMTGTKVSAKNEDFRIDNGKLTAYLGTDTFVSVPNSVNVIGEKAFAGNTTIQKLELPNSLKSIEYMAFGDCTALTDVTIPDSVTKVGPGAFKGCSALTYFEIGKNVSSWGSGVFNECSSLAGLILDEENEYLTYYNGALYNGNMTMLYQVLANRGGENYVMPAEVEQIDMYAFWGLQNVKNVMTSSLVSNIGQNAFASMGSVENVVLTSTVKHIADKAFIGNDNLKQVFMPASVTDISPNAITANPNVKILTSKGSTADNYGTNKKIPIIYSAELPIDFNDSNVNNQEKPSMTILVGKEVPIIPSTNKNNADTKDDTKENEESEEEETDTTEYINPIDVKEDGVTAKTRIVNGQAVILMNNKEAKVHGIPNGVHPEVVDENLTGRENDSEESASEEVSEENASEEVTSDKNYQNEATENKSETVNENKNNDKKSQIIEERKYYKQKDLTDYTISEKIKEIGRLAFARTGLTKIVIPDSVTTIGYGAFYVCEDLKDVTIPDSVTDIGNKAFADTIWMQDWLSGKTDTDGGDFLIVGDGILLAYRGTQKHVEIPESVKQIGPEVFKGHTEITDVTIPKSVTKIGGSAFVGCSSLTGLKGCEGLKTVMSGAFRGSQITEKGWQ